MIRSTRASFAGYGCGVSGLIGGALMPVSTSWPRTVTDTLGRPSEGTTQPLGSHATWTRSWPSLDGPSSRSAIDRHYEPDREHRQRTIEGQEKQASVLLLGDLEAAEVDCPPPPRRCVPDRCR